MHTDNTRDPEIYYEFFEGSVPLAYMAAMMKEYSTESAN
jgi:hypothetical protein